MKTTLLCALLCLSSSALKAGGDPKIVFDGETYQFGTVYQDDKVNHLFHFRNQGKGDLQILDMKTSCGCTAAQKDQKEKYGPGEEGDINVTYSVGHAKGDAQRTVTVWTNDPDHKQVALIVVGKVQAGYSTDPEDGYIRFDGAQRGQSLTKTVRVYSPENKPFKVLSTKKNQNNPNLTAHAVPSSQGGWDLKVTLSRNAPVGRFAEQITMITNLDRAQTITLPVYADVVGPFEVTPPSVQASFVEGAPTESSNVVQIRRRDGKPLRLISASSEAANVRATVRKAQAGSEPAELEVLIKKADNQTYGNAKVKVKTGDVEQPEIEIMASWVVPQGPRPNAQPQAFGAPAPQAH